MTYDFVGNEDNDPQKAQPGDHVILGVSTKGGDHSRFAGSVQQYARDGVRVLAGEQYAVNVDGKDFTRQVVEVDPETGEEKVTTVDLSATDFRNAVEEGDVQTVAEFLPQAIRGQAKEVINMMGAQVAMSDPEQAQIAETLMRLIEETMDEISAMAGGAVEGPASKKKKKEADTLIREDDEEIEENMADLAWGPAALSLDPVERAPYYEEGDEIETMAKKRSGANVALGE